MYVKTISYTDYNGNERTEPFYFNFTKAELAEMELTSEGGMRARIDRIINAKDQARLVRMFKQLILDAYGEKSEDGKHFIKSKELSKRFSCTEAYSILFMELATNTEAAQAFVNGIIPQDIKNANK